VSQNRSALFRGRHFEDVIIILCVRWYLRYSLSYRDLEEMMAERGLSVDHVSIWRWVQHYAPILNLRLRRDLEHPNRSWRVDETYVRVAGKWAYLYRAVDSAGDTIDFMLSPKRDLTAAKLFLSLALSGTGGIRPRVINVDGHPAYARAIAELKRSGDLSQRCRCRPRNCQPENREDQGDKPPGGLFLPNVSSRLFQNSLFCGKRKSDKRSWLCSFRVFHWSRNRTNLSPSILKWRRLQANPTSYRNCNDGLKRSAPC